MAIVNIRLHPPKSWIFIIELFMIRLKSMIMKESNFLADNATIKLHQKEVLLNTKGHYMKESNMLVGNATME